MEADPIDTDDLRETGVASGLMLVLLGVLVGEFMAMLLLLLRGTLVRSDERCKRVALNSGDESYVAGGCASCW